MGEIIMKSKTEIWQALPGVPGIEVSTLGKVRTLDRVALSENGTQFTEGRVLKQYDNGLDYLLVSIPVDGRRTMKLVHRLVAQTFISNPDRLQEVNHKDGDRANNNVSNLEWCSHSYNQKYREKFGVSQTEAAGHPLFAINLATLEVSHFRSQHEASRILGVNRPHINAVIKGKRKQAGSYWFTNDDEKAADAIKRKLNDIKGDAK